MQRNIVYFVLISIFLVVILFLPDQFHFDMEYWRGWARYIEKYGITGIYSLKLWDTEPTNYPPLFLYLLDFYGLIAGPLESVMTKIHYIKIFALIFDFLSAASIIYFFRANKNVWLVLLLILSPAFLYNSAVWGQVDSIFTFFAVVAYILLWNKRIVVSMLFLSIALLFKMQTLFFLPVYTLYLLLFAWNDKKKIILGMILSIIVIFLSFTPFLLAGEFTQIKSSLFGNINLYPNVSMGAFNFWYLLFGEQSNDVNDLNTIIGVSYKLWGMIVYFLTWLYMAILFWRKRRTIKDESNIKFFLISMILFYLVFYFFSTEMHERYSHPIILLSFIYYWHSNRIWIYILVSCAYFINLEFVSALLGYKFHEIIWLPYLSIIFYVIAIILSANYFRKHYAKFIQVS